MFFFFKQKTAYEMRISDWSSDVCSSDLRERCPILLLSVLRDCIDLRAALLAGGREVPADLGLRIEGMAALLRLLQHGDGGLALFNGSNEGEDLQIGLVLQRGSEERRVRNEGGSTCRSRWSPDH